MNTNSRFPWIVAAAAMLFALVVLVRSELSERQQWQPQSNPAIPNGYGYPPNNPYPGHPEQWRPLDTPVPRYTPAPASTPASAPSPAIRPENTPSVAATPSPTATPESLYLLQGRVTGIGGAPLEKARVRVVLGGDKPAEKSAVTGPDGRFEITSIKAETIDQLVVEAASHSPTVLENLPLPLPDLLELGLIPLAGVDAIVLDASTGQGEDQLFNGEMESSLLRYAEAEATTEIVGISQPNLPVDSFVPARNQQVVVHDGLLSFNNVEPGRYKVVVRAGSKLAESASFEVGPAERTSTTLVLGSQQTVRGHVVKEDGIPVAQASITLAPARELSSAPHFPDYLGFTDGDGQFVIPEVLPGAYWLTAGASGFTTKTMENFSIDPAEEPTPTSITLTTQEPLLIVAVVSGEGRPLANAPMVLMNSTGRPPKTFFGKSDDAGLHRFDLVSSGSFTLSVTHPEITSRQKLVHLSLGETEIKEISVSFGSVSRVTGTVKVAGKTHTGLLNFTYRGTAMSDVVVKADDKGEFSAELEPGEYMITAPGKAVQQMVTIPALPSHKLNLDLK